MYCLCGRRASDLADSNLVGTGRRSRGTGQEAVENDHLLQRVGETGAVGLMVGLIIMDELPYMVLEATASHQETTARVVDVCTRQEAVSIILSIGRNPIEHPPVPNLVLQHSDRQRYPESSQLSHRNPMSTSRLLHSLEMRLPLSIECRRRAPSLTGAIHCTLKTLSFPTLSHPLPLSSSPLPTIFIHTTIYRTLCSFSYRFSCLEFLTRDLVTPYTATVITFSQFPPRLRTSSCCSSPQASALLRPCSSLHRWLVPLPSETLHSIPSDSGFHSLSNGMEVMERYV